MKKLLSVLLALVMAFSLATPGFAAMSQSQNPAPGEFYSNWAKQAWDDTCAGQPERTTQFLTQLPGWFSSHYAKQYAWDGSLEEFTQSYTCVEAAYLHLFEVWNWYQEQEQARKEFISSRGGAPGQINVMVNGKYVKFGDAVPENTGGRVMVPARAIVEALGGEANDDGSDSIRCTAGGFEYTFSAGKNTVTVRPAAQASADMPQPEDIVMDCAPYIKDGQAYIPARFFAQALDYQVDWDGEYQTVVFTGLNALAAQIDKDFTIYNKLMSQNVLGDQARKAAGSGKADVTLFDTLDGDKTGEAVYSYELTASRNGASGKMEYDLTALWELLKGYIPMPLDEASAEERARSLALMGSLMKGSGEIRMDLDKQRLYFSMPGLFEALSGYLAESEARLPKDSWLSMSLENMDIEGLSGQAPTVGSILCAAWSSQLDARSYDEIQQAAALLAKVCGDAKFTRKGNASVLTLTRDDIFALMGEPAAAQAGSGREMLDKFGLTLSVKDNGDMDVDFQCNMAQSGSEVNWGNAIQFAVKGSTRGGKTQTTMELHIKNVLKVALTLQQTLTETSAAPELAPPKGVLVLPIDGTLPGGAITSPDGETQLLP